MPDPDGSPFRPPGSDADPYRPRDRDASPQYGDGYSYGAGYGGYGSGYGYPGYGPGYGYPGYAPAPRNENMAVLSLVLALVSWPLCLGYGIGVAASIAGLVLGIIARRRIRASGGMLTGDGMAVGGIVVSVVNIVAFVAAIAFVIVALTSASIGS